MTILDKIPYSILIILATMLAIAPFGNEPHLLEKFEMLTSGTLSKPIDIFDLVLHSTPLIILALKVLRSLLKKNSNQTV